jgi:hypothetical protein
MSYNSNLPAWQYSNPVLSLRQWYAGQALAGLMVSEVDASAETVAMLAFKMADAVIEAEGKDASS